MSTILSSFSLVPAARVARPGWGRTRHRDCELLDLFSRLDIMHDKGPFIIILVSQVLSSIQEDIVQYVYVDGCMVRIRLPAFHIKDMDCVCLVGLRVITDGQGPAVGAEGQGGHVIQMRLGTFRARKIPDQPARPGIPEVDGVVVAHVRHEPPARGQVPAVGAVGDGIYVSRADGEFPDDPLFRDACDAQVADDASPDGEVLPVGRDGPELGDDILADDGDDGLVGLPLVVGRDGPIEQEGGTSRTSPVAGGGSAS